MGKGMKRNIYILIALLLIGFVKYIPAPEGMNQAGMNVIGVFTGSLLLWLTVSIDWPSLLCVFAIGLIPEIGFKNVFLSLHEK